MRRWLLLFAPLAAIAAGCRYDPVPEHIIDALGPEKGTPSATHRPGQPCLVCHSAYEGASPAFAVAGTLFTKNMDGTLGPAPEVGVTIYDSAGKLRKACSNTAGNFFVKTDDWADITFPLGAQAGERGMSSLIGRDGSCASCHLRPSEKSLDQGTGASRSSPGVILVDPTAPGAACGGG